MNGQYIRNIEKDDFIESALLTIESNLDRELFEKEIYRLNKIMPSVQERLETLNDLIPQVKFLLDEPFYINEED